MTDVTDADRKAAEAFVRKWFEWDRSQSIAARHIPAGEAPLTLAFTRHREASIAPYAEALRTAQDEFNAIKELADHDETQLCWSTANDAIAQIDALLGKGPEQ